jgi:hypothetical protein
MMGLEFIEDPSIFEDFVFRGTDNQGGKIGDGRYARRPMVVAHL